MLHKIGIGTANFSQPYGMLSEGRLMEPLAISAVVDMAIEAGIDTFDTAFAYGDSLRCLTKKSGLRPLKIITKFSVLDDHKTVLSNMSMAKEQYHFDGYYGLLVHDVQNLGKVEKKNLTNLVDNLFNKNLITKFGVSVYDLNELECFKSIMVPDIIQIPLNPLNQTFMNDQFLAYVDKNDIEVHARSLFLQGVLLAEKLPQTLAGLESLWNMFIIEAESHHSRLEAVLSWALGQRSIHKWILGIASIENLTEIIQCTKNSENIKSIDLFDSFKYIKNPLVDPRNWNFS